MRTSLIIALTLAVGLAACERPADRNVRGTVYRALHGVLVYPRSLLVEMDDQPSMIFAGDAAYTYENLERLIVGGFHLDPTAAVESLRRLKRLARTHDAQIYPSHEMAPFQTWKKAPTYYEG